MLTNLAPDATLFLADVDRIQERIAKANSQVSSGKKIQVASDAPDQVSASLQLRADLQHNQQIQSNLALAATDAHSADNALSSAIQLMDSAVSLATQASSLDLDNTGRQALAQQAQALQQQMVAYSQTTVEGRFIFSGDQDSSPSYEYQANAANPAVLLITPSATRLVQDPSGGTFAASRTAREIFDHTDPTTGMALDDNVFAALNALQQALSGNNVDAVTQSISKLKTAAEHLNSMQAFYGNVEKRIASASDFAANNDVQLQTQLSQKEDADITAAALELTQSSTQLQAAFQMRAQRPHQSLFNYLS